jgi:hypothetical protein
MAVVVDSGFEHWSDEAKHYKIDICSFFALYARSIKK